MLKQWHSIRLVGPVAKALDETNWEADTLKRDLNQANRDKDELEQRYSVYNVIMQV